jgi:hypothetical protein
LLSLVIDPVKAVGDSINFGLTRDKIGFGLTDYLLPSNAPVYQHAALQLEQRRSAENVARLVGSGKIALESYTSGG